MSDSHSDVDDELLRLAGGDVGSSNGGSRPSTRQHSRSRSRSRSRSASRSRSRARSQSHRPAEDSPARSTAAKKVQAKKRRGSAESEDEGEASEPGSPGSQGSAAMDESDSDDGSDTSPGKAAGDEENKYPVEGLFTSNAERREIMNMREVEREQILAEREAEKERLRQKALLRRLVTNNEGKQNKRKGGDDEDDFEESARKKARAGAKSGLDLLKRARAEKKERRSRRDGDRRRDRSPSFNSSSTRDRHSDESDDGWTAPTKKKRSKTPPEQAPPAELRDIERCRLSRTRFARVAFYPGHDDALTGCYVRIHIGPDPNTKQGIYRMAVIKGFRTGRPYAIENDRGKTIVVDQYVFAAHGKAEREWPFIACSEGNFIESEWNRYQLVCKTENVQIPKKPELVKRAAAINGLINHDWKAEEVSEKIARQNALMDRFSGAERGRLEQNLAQARAHGNVDLANELQDKLDNTPQPRLAFSTTLKKSTPSKPSAPSQQDRLAEKNAVNRQMNAKNVREAQLADRRRIRDKEREDAIARGDIVKTKSKRPGQKAADEASSNRLDSDTSTPSATPKQAKPKETAIPLALARLKEAQAKSIVPQIHKTLTDDDIIGALDLDIDVEID